MNAHRTLACGFVPLVLALRAWAGEAVRVEVCNLSGETLGNVPVTFGLVLRVGEVPTGQTLGGAQVDVKRCCDDGSLRVATVSAVLPRLPSDGSAAVALVAGPAQSDAEARSVATEWLVSGPPCDREGGFPKAREAFDWLDASLPEPRDALARDPLWAIQPRSRRVPQ